MLALVAWSLYESRQLQEQRTLIQTQNLATILEQNLSEKLRTIDLALHAARDEFERQTRQGTVQAGELDQFLGRLQARLPELDGLRITDARGQIRYGQGLRGLSQVSLADRDYFRCAREATADTRCAGQAVRSRVTGQWITALAYRLNDAQGGFAGMVYATIRVDELTRLFSALEMGRQGSLILRDSQYRLITRYPAVPGTAGEVGNAKTSPEFRALIEQGLRTGSYVARHTSDEVARINSFRRLDGIDWIVVAGLAEDEYLAGWYDQRQRYLAVALLFLVSSLLAARVISRHWQTQLRTAGELRAARDAADAANRAKSQFLAVMSHELRTPLNGVLGMAQILMMPDITEQERIDYARTINHSGLTLQNLLNDILDLSKIEAGRMDLQAADFDPGELVRETASLFAEAAGKKGLTLTVDRGTLPHPAYRGDPLRLRQILTNLANNAIKFTDCGEVRLGVAAEDGTLCFTVSDTGIGIAADKLGSLFQPFSQVDDSFTRRYGGTGLGLAISRQLLQLMGGEITVDSVPGQGSTFRCRLPAIPAELPPAGFAGDDSAGEAAGSAPETPVAERATEAAAVRPILLVDDNRINRKVVRTLLEKHGHTVAEAENGEEALALLEHRACSLILMDCQMPVMDGYTATRLLRAREAERQQPHLPVIALTAAAFDNDREQCALAGMDDFLSKPVVADQLLAAIARWQG